MSKEPIFGRIQKSDVTEALMSALEEADRFKTVVILYETKEEDNSPGGFIYNGNVTVAEINFLIDRFKSWLMEKLF